ncbi:MAG: class III signal peptide-containing protein [Methanobrevibacter thaueri]|nr:class III signal peptide-containing protein [Methanobrevibacter thaueri]
MKDNKGQISAEFLFLFGVLIIIVMLSIIFAANENELNMAMAAAKNGVLEGITTSSSGIYPTETFNDYSITKTNLFQPYSVEIINISYNDLGYDTNYDKKRIQFKVYAKTSDRFTHDELTSIGDRINYNLRKSIAISFNTTASTNKLYNPVFSNHYVYTTANVKWI